MLLAIFISEYQIEILIKRIIIVIISNWNFFILFLLSLYIFYKYFCISLKGFVGKTKIQIPVSRLRSEPWVIFIEKLFLIAGPVSSSEAS